jgi:hypothetical protein
MMWLLGNVICQHFSVLISVCVCVSVLSFDQFSGWTILISFAGNRNMISFDQALGSSTMFLLLWHQIQYLMVSQYLPPGSVSRI